MSPRAAITGVFALAGFLFSSWYARLPQIQDDLGLGPAELGLALAGAPIGLLLAQPVVGALSARRGSYAILAAAPLYVAAVVLPALAGNGVTLFLAVAVTGGANGVLDVSMNAQGIAVERATGLRIFNSLHAVWALGALGGAALAAVAIAAGVSPVAHLAAIAVAGSIGAYVLTRHLIRDAGSPDAPAFARPSRRLAALGVVAFCALLAEGSVFDWSSIFMVDEAGAAQGVAPLALAAFALSMAGARLAGDRLAERFGSEQLARAGGLVGAGGLALVITVAMPVATVVGFALTGVGISILFPLAIRAASVQADPPGADLAAVMSAGYVGFLVGPPVVGLVAGAADLRVALTVPLVLCLVAAWLARHLRTDGEG
jgi:MFS family permease